MQGAAELRKIFKKLSFFLHSGRGKFTKRKIRLGGRVLSLGRLRYSNGLCLRSQILCLSQVARIKGQYNFHIKVAVQSFIPKRQECLIKRFIVLLQSIFYNHCGWQSPVSIWLVRLQKITKIGNNKRVKDERNSRSLVMQQLHTWLQISLRDFHNETTAAATYMQCTNIFWFCLPTFFLTNKEERSRIFLDKTIVTVNWDYFGKTFG